MKSVAIVSLDDELSEKVAKQLSEKLNYKYANVAQMFEKVLLLDIKSSVLNTEHLVQKERNLIRHCVEQEGVVLCIKHDMFLSNKNYNLTKNIQVLLLECDFDDKIKVNLQNLIKKHANFSTKEKDIDKILTFLKG